MTTDLPRTGFLTPQSVKRHFAISNSTMYAWCASGYMPSMIAVGPRARRFRAEDILRFEQERMAASIKQTQGGKNG